MGPHSLQLIETVGLIHPLYSTLMFLPKKPRPFRSAFSFVPTNIRALRCSIRHPLQCTLSDCPSLAIATVPSTFDSGGASMTFTKASGSFRLMKMSAYARSRESSSRSSSVSTHQFHFYHTTTAMLCSSVHFGFITLLQYVSAVALECLSGPSFQSSGMPHSQ